MDRLDIADELDRREALRAGGRKILHRIEDRFERADDKVIDRADVGEGRGDRFRRGEIDRDPQAPAPTSRAAACARPRSRLVTITRSPRAARLRAMASPIPIDPPTTTALFASLTAALHLALPSPYAIGQRRQIRADGSRAGVPAAPRRVGFGQGLKYNIFSSFIAPDRSAIDLRREGGVGREKAS